MGVYSEPHATKDLDLYIRSNLKNSEAVFRALADFGAPLSGIAPTDFRDSPTTVFQVGQPPARVGILQAIDAVSFDEAWQSRTETLVDGVAAHIISAEHLIKNKLHSGRLRDLADVEAIREATKETGI